MIAAISVALAAYQVVALGTGRPRVSVLSHTGLWAPVIWAWWLALGLHFVAEARS